jgi:hypothetical protein
MPLPQIIRPPDTPRGFDEWSFHNYAHHQAIIVATEASKNVRLVLYQIWPFNPDAAQNWLLQHQQQHNDMNAIYHTDGFDLSSVDFRDRRAVEAWMALHYQEHLSVAQRCGFPI